MSNFDKIYDRFVKQPPAPELRSLLKRFYYSLIKKPYELAEIKQSMTDVLMFLCSEAGRTDANCRAVDMFICIDDGWENDWSDLPEAFHEIVFDMGHGLHDTVKSPDIAKNFECLPEQLLERTKRLEV